MMMYVPKKIVFLLLLGLTASIAQAAQDQVIINSADWQDVYLGAHYAGFNDLPAKFLTSSEHAPVLLNNLDLSRKNVLLIESDKKPFVFSYKSSLEAAGFTVEEILSSGTALNIELARRVNTKNFIIIDDSYGYNAISVAPFAAKNKYFVLLINGSNIDELYSFLKANGVDNLIIYGTLDIDARTKLAEFNPETINKGSRFDNNLEMINRYGKTSQIIFTNGEFIEEQLLSGKEPVLFLGREAVPDKVIEYIRSNDVKTGVVVGNELAGTAHQLKEATNITLFLKFGQGFGTGGFAEVKALDVFPLPSYELNVNISSIKYNKAMKALEVTYENQGKVGAYLRSSIEVFSSGTRIITLGDREPFYLNRESSISVSYSTELNGQNLTAKFTTLFGEAPGSLDRILYKELNIEQIEVLDNSSLNISGVSYDKDAHKLRVGIKNIGGVKTYAKAQVTLLIYGDEKVLVQDNPMLLEPGDSKDAVFITTLSDTNIEENPVVKVSLNYGERESSLIKVLEGSYPLEVRSDMTILIMALIIILVIITGIVIWKREKKKNRNRDQ